MVRHWKRWLRSGTPSLIGRSPLRRKPPIPMTNEQKLGKRVERRIDPVPRSAKVPIRQQQTATILRRRRHARSEQNKAHLLVATAPPVPVLRKQSQVIALAPESGESAQCSAAMRTARTLRVPLRFSLHHNKPLCPMKASGTVPTRGMPPRRHGSGNASFSLFLLRKRSYRLSEN